MKAQLGSLASRIDSNQEEMKAMLDACLENMEENPGERKSVAVRGEVPKEEAAAKSSRALKKRHGGWKLTAGSQRNGPRELRISEEIGLRPQRDDPPCRSGTMQGKRRREKLRWRNMERRAPTGRTDVKRLSKDPDCKMGIKDTGTRRQLRLKIERTSDRFDMKAFILEIAKRAAGMSTGLREIRDRTLWRYRPLRN
jgi:hypothetical protein